MQAAQRFPTWWRKRQVLAALQRRHPEWVKAEARPADDAPLTWGELKTIASAALKEIQEELTFTKITDAELRLLAMLAAWSGRAVLPPSTATAGEPVIEREVMDEEYVTPAELKAIVQRFAERLKFTDVDWLHERPSKLDLARGVATLEQARRSFSFDFAFDSDNDGTADREERDFRGNLEGGQPRGKREQEEDKVPDEIEENLERSRTEHEEKSWEATLEEQWIKKHKLSGAEAGADADPDRDGVTNEVEREHGLDPRNRYSSGAGKPDDYEVVNGRRGDFLSLRSGRVLSLQGVRQANGTQLTWTRNEEDLDESPFQFEAQNADGTWRHIGTAPVESTSLFVPDTTMEEVRVAP